MSTFWFLTLASNVVGPIGAALGIWVLVAFSTSLYPDCWRVFQGSARRTWRRDAALAIAVYLAASFGVGRLTSVLFSRFHGVAPVRIDINPDLLGSLLPGAGYLIRGLMYALLLAASAAVAIYLVELGVKGRAWWFYLGAAVLFVSLGPAGAHSAAEFFVSWSASALKLLATVGIIAVFFRDNPVAYLGAGFCATIASPMISMLDQPASSYVWNGVLLGALGLAVLTWLLWGGREQAPESTSVMGAT